MNFIFESPYPAIVLGVLVEAFLAVLLVQTQNGKVLLGMIGVLLVAGGLVLMEQVVVTPFEEIEDFFDNAAASLESNDSQRVLALIDPTAEDLRLQAGLALRGVTIETARVANDLKVTFNNTMSPPEATAVFTGRIVGSTKSGSVSGANYVRKFTVRLKHIGDRWYVFSYKDSEPFHKSSP